MVMQFDYISDLHLPHYVKDQAGITAFVRRLTQDKQADVLILAGDISERGTDIVTTLEAFAAVYSKIFFVFGNHDLYLVSNRQVKKYHANSNLKVLAIQAYFKDHERVVILDNTLIEYEGLQIAGSKNWYSLSQAKDALFWWQFMSDSSYLYPQGSSTSQRMHERDLDFLRGLPLDIDILITHVPPIHFPESGYAPNGCFYYYDREFPTPKLWFSGHQHIRGEKRLGNTRLYLNPYGYPGEVKNPGILTVDYFD